MNVSTTPGAFDCARTPIAARFRRIALAGAVAVAVSGLGVPAASAGQSQEIATGGGSVVFKHRGERSPRLRVRQATARARGSVRGRRPCLLSPVSGSIGQTSLARRRFGYRFAVLTLQLGLFLA